MLRFVCSGLLIREKTSAGVWIPVRQFLWPYWGVWGLYEPEQKSCKVQNAQLCSSWKVKDWKVSNCVPSSLNTIDGAEERIWMPEVDFLQGCCWLRKAVLWIFSFQWPQNHFCPWKCPPSFTRSNVSFHWDRHSTKVLKSKDWEKKTNFSVICTSTCWHK